MKFASFWTSPIGRALRGEPETQLVACWLIGFAAAVRQEVFPAGPAYIAADTGLPSKEIARALDDLQQLGFLAWDEALGTIALLHVHAYARDDVREEAAPAGAVLQ